MASYSKWKAEWLWQEDWLAVLVLSDIRDLPFRTFSSFLQGVEEENEENLIKFLPFLFVCSVSY